jgi:hypothetical protein
MDKKTKELTVEELRCGEPTGRRIMNRIRENIVFDVMLSPVLVGYASPPPARAQARASATAILNRRIRNGSVPLRWSKQPAAPERCFGRAKSKLSVADFSEVSKVVRGMDAMLKAAPQPKSTSPPDSLASSLPGSTGGLASVANAFKSLGCPPGWQVSSCPS